MANRNNQGYLVLFAIFFLALFIIAATSLLGYTTLNIKGVRQSYTKDQALYLAQAGVDKALHELNINPNYGGETGVALGSGEFSVTITTVDAITKRIVATGYIPNIDNPVQTKVVRATASINASQVAFNFGVQVGEGGLSMGENTTVNGNIFSNGNISGSHDARITGSATVAAGTSAAADQQWTAQNADFAVGNIAGRSAAAQSFIPSVSSNLNKVSLYLKKVGLPGDLTVRIVSDNSGSPSKTVLASGSISASGITGSYGYVDGLFASAPNLTSGIKYWIMLVSPVNSGNYFHWGMDNTDAYPNNTGKYSASWNAKNPVWSAAGGDFNFKTYMGGNATSLSNITVGGDATAQNLSNCTVNGSAFYQTITSCSVLGTSTPNSVPPPPAPMPISDAQIQEWETAASQGGVINGNYNVSGTVTMGPKQINGNLVITNGAILKLTGPIWVKGNITISNNGQAVIDSSLGNFGTVLLADNPDNPSGSGLVVVDNNGVVAGNGSPNSFLMLLSTNTSVNAMSISNNATGAIYYAAHGTVQVANNAGGNQITGYAISMSNNSVVNYNAGLQSATFSNGPGGSWNYLSGTYVIEP